MSSVKTIGNGKNGTVTYKYEWEINNFLSYNGKDLMYRSPSFCASGSTWYIQIHPNGCACKDSTGYVSLFLCRESSQYSTLSTLALALKQ